MNSRVRAAEVALVVMTLGVVAAGCSGSGVLPSGDRVVHGDRDGVGVLSGSAGQGGYTMDRHDGRDGFTWGTFGEYVLCTTEPGVPARIQSVRPHQVVAAARVETAVHTVSAAQARAAGPQEVVHVGDAWGSPREAMRGVVGTLSTRVAPRTIVQPCAESVKYSMSDEELTGRMTELLVGIKAGPRGALIDRVDVDYEAGGKQYTLRLTWRMAVCGSALPRELVEGCQEAAPQPGTA